MFAYTFPGGSGSHGFAVLCVTKDPIMIVMERVSERSLLSYIEERGFTEASPLPLPTLLEFASHAAAGLKYLTEHGIVHRDVAARNILLDVKGKHFLFMLGASRLWYSSSHPRSFYATSCDD